MIGLHFRTSVSYIRRAPFQALAAISILTLTFFVATVIAVVLYASNQVLVEFETRPQIIAFLKKDAPIDQANTLAEKLKNDSRVRNVKLVSKEEAVEIYKDATADNPLLAELVSPSIFPSSVEFSAADLEFTGDLIDEVKKEQIVDSVGFTASIRGENSLDEVLTRLRNITYFVRVAGLSAVAILATTSFLVLMVVISMRLQSRKSEMETLSLIGATRGFISTPIMLEAIHYAIIGVIAGWLLGLIVILYATPSIVNYFGAVEILPRETLAFFTLLGLILLIEFAISLTIALLGSILAVSRAFK